LRRRSGRFEIEALVQRMTRLDYGRSGEIAMSALAVLEMACWDIVGKAASSSGRPARRGRLPPCRRRGGGAARGLGILVNVAGVTPVAPFAAVEPDLFDDTFDLNIRARAVPRGRPGLPSDAAPTVAFLCSPQAEFITGRTLYIDGGTTARLAIDVTPE
jgi:NAD(P)-dependent dehydrogenase (short-subunit alcohol dehydrogenase family)